MHMFNKVSVALVTRGAEPPATREQAREQAKYPRAPAGQASPRDTSCNEPAVTGAGPERDALA
jgi:hypothetical protein